MSRVARRHVTRAMALLPAAVSFQLPVEEEGRAGLGAERAHEAPTHLAFGHHPFGRRLRHRALAPVHQECRLGLARRLRLAALVKRTRHKLAANGMEPVDDAPEELAPRG